MKVRQQELDRDQIFFLALTAMTGFHYFGVPSGSWIVNEAV